MLIVNHSCFTEWKLQTSVKRNQTHAAMQSERSFRSATAVSKTFCILHCRNPASRTAWRHGKQGPSKKTQLYTKNTTVIFHSVTYIIYRYSPLHAYTVAHSYIGLLYACMHTHPCMSRCIYIYNIFILYMRIIWCIDYRCVFIYRCVCVCALIKRLWSGQSISFERSGNDWIRKFKLLLRR